MKNIAEYLLMISRKSPESIALVVQQQEYTYQNLFQQALSMGNLLQTVDNAQSICGIYSERNFHLYLSILSCVLSEQTFMPLNSHESLTRLQYRVELVKPGVLFFAARQHATFLGLLNTLTYQVNVIVFSEDDLVFFQQQHLPHPIILWQQQGIDLEKTIIKRNHDTHKLAYLLFTSGSTGLAKAVGIQLKALQAFIHAVCERNTFSADDHFLQLSELTFDLSIYDIFISWYFGATLFVVPEDALLELPDFINQYSITCCSFVPATITLLQQLQRLKSSQFPSVRYTLFCGEPLLQSQALQWHHVAPYSIIENLYGPTEATVVCFGYRWDPQHPFSANSILPIGQALARQHFAVIDNNNELITSGVGQLCLAGPQVINSYWNANQSPEFQRFAWDLKQRLWYCTGDIVAFDQQYGLRYIGRRDDQWQVRGYRVEKVEIENEYRQLANNDAIAVIPERQSEGGIVGIILITINAINIKSLMAAARKSLPSYMLPSKTLQLEKLPVNANGKIDYIALKQYVQGMKI